jgi:hypothetical protein
MTMHRLKLPFQQGFAFYLKQHDCHSQPILLFSVSPIEEKPERPPLDTIEVI